MASSPPARLAPRTVAPRPTPVREGSARLAARPVAAAAGRGGRRRSRYWVRGWRGWRRLGSRRSTRCVHCLLARPFVRYLWVSGSGPGSDVDSVFCVLLSGPGGRGKRAGSGHGDGSAGKYQPTCCSLIRPSVAATGTTCSFFFFPAWGGHGRCSVPLGRLFSAVSGTVCGLPVRSPPGYRFFWCFVDLPLSGRVLFPSPLVRPITLSSYLVPTAPIWTFLVPQEESDFLDPLREQLGYLASAKEVHRGRGRALDALQVRVWGWWAFAVVKVIPG